MDEWIQVVNKTLSSIFHIYAIEHENKRLSQYEILPFSSGADKEKCRIHGIIGSGSIASSTTVQGICPIAKIGLLKTLLVCQKWRIDPESPVLQIMDALKKINTVSLTTLEKLTIQAILDEGSIYFQLIKTYNPYSLTTETRKHPQMLQDLMNAFTLRTLAHSSNSWWTVIPKQLFLDGKFSMPHLGITRDCIESSYFHDMVLDEWQKENNEKTSSTCATSPLVLHMSHFFKQLVEQTSQAVETMIFHRFQSDAQHLYLQIQTWSKQCPRSSDLQRTQLVPIQDMLEFIIQTCCRLLGQYPSAADRILWSAQKEQRSFSSLFHSTRASTATSSASDRKSLSDHSKLLSHIHIWIQKQVTQDHKVDSLSEESIHEMDEMDEMDEKHTGDTKESSSSHSSSSLSQPLFDLFQILPQNETETEHELQKINCEWAELAQYFYLHSTLPEWVKEQTFVLDILERYIHVLNEDQQYKMKPWIHFLQQTLKLPAAKNIDKLTDDKEYKRKIQRRDFLQQQRQDWWKRKISGWQDDIFVYLFHCLETPHFVPYGRTDHESSLSNDLFAQHLDTACQWMIQQFNTTIKGESLALNQFMQTPNYVEQVSFFSGGQASYQEAIQRFQTMCRYGDFCHHKSEKNVPSLSLSTPEARIGRANGSRVVSSKKRIRELETEMEMEQKQDKKDSLSRQSTKKAKTNTEIMDEWSLIVNEWKDTSQELTTHMKWSETLLSIVTRKHPLGLALLGISCPIMKHSQLVALYSTYDRCVSFVRSRNGALLNDKIKAPSYIIDCHKIIRSKKTADSMTLHDVLEWLSACTVYFVWFCSL